MANTFKNLTAQDVANTRSLLHETVPISATIAWNYDTPDAYPADSNIKTVYSEMFEQVYDAPITSSAANHIFDLTLGVHASSDSFVAPYDSTKDANAAKRKAIYNLLAQRLVGFAADGSIKLFDADGDFSGTTGDKYKEVIAITFSRLAYKDEIKKGSFELQLAMNPLGYDPDAGTDPDDTYAWDGGAATDSILLITDVGAESDYKVNSPAGEYGVLYVEQGAGVDPIIDPDFLDANDRVNVGLIFYQAGIVILNPYLFDFATAGAPNVGPGLLSIGGGEVPGDFDLFLDLAGSYSVPTTSTKYTITDLMQGYQIAGNFDEDLTIETFCDAFRQRIYSIEFQNSIELNSTVYFCRANHNEFNYSSNPSYLDGSRMRVKTNSMDAPVSYITGVSLCSANNEVLATAKLSEPIKKSTDVDLVLRVRLDY